MKVEKRDGTLVDYNLGKITSAITKANKAVTQKKNKLLKKEIDEVSKIIDEKINNKESEFYKKYIKYEEYKGEVTDNHSDSIIEYKDGKLVKFVDANKPYVEIEDIQDLVEDTLIEKDYKAIAKEYIKYRQERTRIRDQKSDLYKELVIKADASDVQNQNANVDEHSFGGRMGEVKSSIMTKLALDVMPEKERESFFNNETYPHDKDSYYVGMHNCLSIPFDDVFEDGINTRQTDIRAPNSASTGGQVKAVVFQLQSLQQFGGVAATHTDISFEPLIRKSFNKHYKNVRYILPFTNTEFNLPDEPKNISIESKLYKGSLLNLKKRYIYNKSMNLLDKELHQTVEALYHNLNTLQSRSGNQLPFTSINYGLGTSLEARMMTKNLIKVLQEGLGKYHRTSIFPCGIFQLKDGINMKKGDPNYDLKKLAISSTVRRFYPNYVNCDWSVQVEGVKKDRDLKRRVLNNLSVEIKTNLENVIKENPKIGEAINVVVDKTDHITVSDKVNPIEEASTMGCVEGNEVITYKIGDKLYVEGFARAWRRIIEETNFQVKQQPSRKQLGFYIDLENVKIYDSEKKDFVNCKRIICNKSIKWNKIYFENGRVLDCTDDHPLPTQRGRIFARDIKEGDEITIIPTQYTSNTKSLDKDYAWLLGVMLCDGCLSNQLSCTFDYKTEKDITDNVNRILSSNRFDLNVNVKEYHRGEKGEYYQVNSYEKTEKNQYTRNAFISLYEGISKNERHIPSIIFESDYDTRLAFMAGMIDADGYINEVHTTRVQIGSVNKELAIQQMLLAQSLGMYASLYENKYSSKNKEKIRYRVEFVPSSDLIKSLISDKKRSHCNKITNSIAKTTGKVVKNISYCASNKYSYDVTTESDHFDVSGIWSHNCRTYNGYDINFDEKYFLSLINEIIKTRKLPKNYLYSGMQKDGRGNIAPHTIILPTLAMEAREESAKTNEDVVEVFMRILEQNIEDTKDFLIERFERICKQKSSSAKFMYENNMMKGYIPAEGIRSALKHGTLAVGQLGLAECLQALIGCDHTTDKGMMLAKRIEQLFKDKCNEYKTKYKLNFGVYYTPAENLCYTSYKKFVKKYGLIENVTAYKNDKGELVERGYFTNSMHVPVWVKIDPFKKMFIESQLTGYSSAGCITYVEIDSNAQLNERFIEQIIDYGKALDLPYIAINVPADLCFDCGCIGDFTEDKCTRCGSTNILEPERVTGYLTGDRRYTFNPGKYQESKDREKHTLYIDSTMWKALNKR